jgi:hypothetical protein
MVLPMVPMVALSGAGVSLRNHSKRPLRTPGKLKNRQTCGIDPIVENPG